MRRTVCNAPPALTSVRSRVFGCLHRHTLIIVGSLIFGVIPVGGVVYLGGRLARPAPTVVGRAPADLPAVTVHIPSASGSRLAGWLVRGAPGRGAVLLLHGVRGNRRDMLGRARLLHRADYTVLLVDLQAHGESPGRQITFGARESLDARAALAFLHHAAPGERVGALGVSLGGAALLLGPGWSAASAADAVVLESVYPTIDEAVADRLRIRLGALGPPLAPLLTWQLVPRFGVSPAALRPIDRIGAIGAPLLMLAGREDRHTPLVESRRLFARARAPKELWVVPGAAHEDLYAVAGAEYERRVLGFFDRYLRRSGRGEDIGSNDRDRGNTLKDSPNDNSD